MRAKNVGREPGPEAVPESRAGASASSLVTFVVDGVAYALPLSTVERALPMVAVSPVPGAPRVVLGVINLEGHVVPAMDLRRRLGLPPHEYGLAAQLLVVRTPRRVLAVAADEVRGVTHVEAALITPADAVLPGLRRVTGLAALPDGLLLIYDIEAFLTLDEEAQLAEALGETKP